jgi:hypothetical protein
MCTALLSTAHKPCDIDLTTPCNCCCRLDDLFQQAESASSTPRSNAALLPGDRRQEVEEELEEELEVDLADEIGDGGYERVEMGGA